jgi:hypothetical protein
MTWSYKQSDGALTLDGILQDEGYSGSGDGRNNPAMQDVVGVGPIPQGQYIIGDAYDDIGGLGPCVMHLDPYPATNTFGRSLFRIHGNNAANDASHGCVILGPATRHLIAASDDRTLVVTA